MIRNAVVHLTNEQPLLADLFAVPTATDSQLVCTNLRSMNGKRPVFADDSDSIFVFPIAQIRFLEVPPGADTDNVGGAVRPRNEGVAAHQGVAVHEAGPGAAPSNGTGTTTDTEGELELDEDFLRRVREA